MPRESRRISVGYFSARRGCERRSEIKRGRGEKERGGGGGGNGVEAVRRGGVGSKGCFIAELVGSQFLHSVGHPSVVRLPPPPNMLLQGLLSSLPGQSSSSPRTELHFLRPPTPLRLVGIPW